MIPIKNIGKQKFWTVKIRRIMFGQRNLNLNLDSDLLLQNQETFLTKPFCLKSPETLRIRGV